MPSVGLTHCYAIFTNIMYSLPPQMDANGTVVWPQIRLAFQSRASLGDRKSYTHSAVETNWDQSCNLLKSTVWLDIWRLRAQFKSKRIFKSFCLATQVAVKKLRSETIASLCHFSSRCYPLHANSFWMFLLLIEHKDMDQALQSLVMRKLLSLFEPERHRIV